MLDHVLPSDPQPSQGLPLQREWEPSLRDRQVRGWRAALPTCRRCGSRDLAHPWQIPPRLLPLVALLSPTPQEGWHGWAHCSHRAHTLATPAGLTLTWDRVQPPSVAALAPPPSCSAGAAGRRAFGLPFGVGLTHPFSRPLALGGSRNWSKELAIKTEQG